MNTQERSEPRGTIIFRRFDCNGHLRGIWKVKNLIVTVGKALQSGLLTGIATDFVSHLAIGTGGGGPAAANTTLAAELAREAVVATQVTTAVANDTAQFVATFVFAAPAAIIEAGLLNDSVGGTLLSRQVFAAINVVALDSLEVTWKIQY